MAKKTQTIYKNNLTDLNGKDGFFRQQKMEVGRFSHGASLITGNFLKMMVFNVALLLFVAPILYLLYTRYVNIATQGSSSGIMSWGVGFGSLPAESGLANKIIFNADLKVYLFLPLCGVLLAVGLAGGTYVMRNLCWDTSYSMVKEFFAGIKQNFLKDLFFVVISAIIVSGSFIGISYLNYLCGAIGTTWYYVIFEILLYVLIVFSIVAMMHSITLTTFYGGKLGDILKKSLGLTFKHFILNPIFLAFSSIGFALLFIESLMSIAFMIVLLFAMILLLVVWTEYSTWLYEREVTPFVSNKYNPTQEEIAKYKNRNSAEESAKASDGYVTVGVKPDKLADIKPVTDDYKIEKPKTYSRDNIKKNKANKDGYQ